MQNKDGQWVYGVKFVGVGLWGCLVIWVAEMEVAAHGMDGIGIWKTRGMEYMEND